MHIERSPELNCPRVRFAERPPAIDDFGVNLVALLLILRQHLRGNNIRKLGCYATHARLQVRINTAEAAKAVIDRFDSNVEVGGSNLGCCRTVRWSSAATIPRFGRR